MKVIIIGNPIAGGGAREKIARALSTLKGSGHDAELMITSRKGDAESFARALSSNPNVTVLAAGGDGTYNEVANGLVNSDTPMAILPLGTTSVLARELGIPLDPYEALEVVMNGRIEQVHLGRISCRFKEGETSRGNAHQISARHFLLMAGIGYDGDSVYNVNERIKKYSGKMAYIFSGLGAIINYHPGPLRIQASQLQHNDISGDRFRIHPKYCTLSADSMEAGGYTAVISKAACYGGDMKITPDARLTSPYLYVFLSHKKRRGDLLRYLSAIISGSVLDLKDISYFRTRSIEIFGDSHIQIDGDYAGRTPAKIDVARDALKLVVPAV